MNPLNKNRADFYKNRNRNLRAECNAIKMELSAKSPHKSKTEIVGDVLDLLQEKYRKAEPPISRNTIHCIWKNKNYGQKK